MSKKFPFRELVPSCNQAASYRYYIEMGKCSDIWKLLEETYGAIRRNETFQTQEIEAEFLHLSSTFKGSPILLLRKRGCTEKDIHKFHELLQFQGT